jgi:hypothetical protein
MNAEKDTTEHAATALMESHETSRKRRKPQRKSPNG